MIRKFLRNISLIFRSRSVCDVESPVRKDPNSLHHDTFINMRFFPAVGGRIVQVTNIDEQSRHNTFTGGQEKVTLYIIPDDCDFSKELEHILSMERLK